MLYHCPNYYLLVSETFDASQKIAYSASSQKTPNGRKIEARHYSLVLGCKVWHIEPGAPFLFIEAFGTKWKILHGEQIGWVSPESCLEIKRVS